MTLDSGEELIGTAGDAQISITSTDISKFYCTNCKNRKHCIHGTKSKNGPVELLKDRCSNDSCECRCKRYYVARNGRLRELGSIDDTTLDDPYISDVSETDRQKTAKLIEMINQEVRSRK